ncbi:MAG: inositol 2-dehydrogenase [Paracoccaceae bacterium]|nr:inositol 2-dehydrogenase [Paracoccaceae bacterium]
MTRIGVLGSGRIGQVHATTIHRLREARLVAVADAYEDAARSLADQTGAEVRETEAIIGADDIDAVVICTPTDTHADLIEDAARAGKAVFCEKPVDLDADRVRACIATVEDAGVPLMVGFQRRFDPHFRALKDALEAGKIGEIEQVIITSRDPAPPPIEYMRRSGGLFRDMTIHDFDMARFLLDEPIRRVLATGAVRVDPAIADAPDLDTATVLMETGSGTQVVISNSRRASYGYDQRVEVHGSGGMLQVGNEHEARLTAATGEGFSSPVLLNFFMTRYLDAYAEEMRAFIDAIGKDAEPPVTARDGLAALLLADAAAKSVEEGGWVEV